MTSRLTPILAAVLAPAFLGAQSAEDLQKQIDQLKAKLAAVEEKASATPDIDARLVKVETKTAGDNIQWGGDLRTRFDSAKEHFKPYQQFMGFMQNTPSAGNPYPFAPIAQQMPAQDWSNSVQWSTRLRLNLGITINDRAKVMGRLAMYKIHGGADVPTFNGSPNTISTSFTAGQVPATDALLVERASLVYRFPAGILSIGRQNTSDGPPFEVREGGEREATPQSLAVNATIDGIGWKFQLDKIGLPENTLFGLCYGVGYESGFGGGGMVKSSTAVVGMNFSSFDGNPAHQNLITPQVNAIGPLKDTTVLGAMFDMPLLFQVGESVHSANLYLGYNRFGNMTDIPFGNTINFPIPGMPSTQYVTATANLGDLDQWTLTWKHKIGDTFTYFVSGGYIKSHPNGQSSQYGAYWTFPNLPAYGPLAGTTQQLSGFGGLMGDPAHSRTASSCYAGVRYDPTPAFGGGVEFNHGSPRWFTYMPATGEYTDKLGARGDVWEAYLHWRFARNAAFRVGYLDYRYTHAFSGWQIGPSPMSGSWESAYNLDHNPMLQYSYPATARNFYAAIEVKF